MENIKEAMKKLRYNQNTLADAVGVSNRTTSNWLTGKTKPSKYDIKKISEVLDLDLEIVTKAFIKKKKEM